MSERNDSIDPNVNVSGRQSYFNEDAKFFKDVYIYGTLYYDFDKNALTKLGDVSISGISTFKGDVYIDGNLNVGILTVRKRLDVGIGGTVLRAIADLEGLPFTSGKVGIANTFPKQTLDVLGTAIISEKVGIGSTSPRQTLDVIGTAIVSQKVGIGGTTLPQQVREVNGRGIRWIAMFAQGVTPGVGFGTIVGIQTDGFFVLDEGIPIF